MHTNTKVIDFYLHSDKETVWDSYVDELWPGATELDWDDPSIRAAKDFRYTGGEVKFELEVDLDTGEARYLSCDGVKLERPSDWG
jgi:hypothetical protein